MRLSRSPAIHIIPQRPELPDCWLSALSSYTGVPYEKVLVAAAGMHAKPLQNGLSTENMLRLARRLRVPMKALSPSKYSLEEDTGILETIGLNHVVLLFRGSIVELRDNALWDPDEYFAHYLARPGKLLVKA